MKELFIKTKVQQDWHDVLEEHGGDFKKLAHEVDEFANFPKQQVEKLVELGYTSITLPKAFGGNGFGVYDLILLQETLARFDSNLALSIGWHLGVVGDIFEKQQWQVAQLDQFAIAIKNGALVNRAVSEAATGSPTRGGRPQTVALREGNHWVLNGRKSFTTASPVLTHFLVSAWIEEKQRIGFFLVHKSATGLSIDETWNVVAMRGTGSHDLVLEDVVVHEDQLVELPDKQAGTYNGWALHIPATYLGIAQAARDEAVQFSVRHSPNSIEGTISDLPNIQRQIGLLDLKLTQARHLLYSVATQYDDPKSRILLTNEVEVVKYTVTNFALEIVDQAMRIVGAKSLSRQNALQRHYRDVRAGLHNPPMDDMTISRLAQTAIEREKSKLVKIGGR